MYIVTVPNVTIYLDRHLAAQVKAQGVPVSEVCQRALRLELAERQRPVSPPKIPGQLGITTTRRQ